jgi:molybdate transport system substrate-binding protein
MIKRLWLLFLTGAIMISACGAPAATVELRTLTVFAAASLADAFDEIIKNFEAANPGVTVKLNFGGSQSLRTQIEQGAQADVFASANTKEMDALVTGNFVAAESPRIFLTNQLVVIMPADNPAGLKELADLAGAGSNLYWP